MLLREVNALSLIITVHHQNRAFQESMLVPGMHFSIHPFPDRTHFCQHSGQLFQPPAAWHNSDGISSKFNISLELMICLQSGLPCVTSVFYLSLRQSPHTVTEWVVLAKFRHLEHSCLCLSRSLRVPVVKILAYKSSHPNLDIWILRWFAA